MSGQPVQRTLEVPEKLLFFLTEKSRFKVAYGGRGSGKSWAAARSLIFLAASRQMRILCTREIQKSIKDSVKKLIDDQIDDMGLRPIFESTETGIWCEPTKSEFIFAGLQNHTVDSIKSYEAIDICWIEEAQTISKKSLDILTPTIRKEGSEIWVTFNPMLDSDEVWKRFVEQKPPSCIAQKVNWSDNPWFPSVLDQERLHCKETRPEDYGNIWEGECRSAVEGAVYQNEMAQLYADGRVGAVSYSSRDKVHAVWDMGWNDSMSIIICQKAGPNAIAILDYIEDSFKTLDHFANLLKSMPYNWGFDFLPHDAAHKDYKTGQSSHDILRRHGRNTRPIPNIGIEQGIRLARMTFPRVWFNANKTQRLLECLKRYRRSVPTTTGEPGSPVHDEFSHGADAFRYLAVVADQLTNETMASRPVVQPYRQVAAGVM